MAEDFWDAVELLNTPYIRTQIDRRNSVLIISYHKELTAESTLQMYAWCLATIEKVGLAGVRGAVYDFSDVQKFTANNLISTQRGANNLNARVDLSRIPVAMITKTIMQEQQVGIAMNVTPGEGRKRIVKTMQQAIAFINEFHRQQAEADSGSETTAST